MIRVGINGYGRIGRAVHRRSLETDDIRVVAINSRADSTSHALLLKRDSVHGTLSHEVEVEGEDLKVNGETVQIFRESEHGRVPWGDLDVDVVIESTGRFTARNWVEPHLESGAKKVLITAPCKDNSVQMVVMGVNHEAHDPADHRIISNASCTTNALAPTLKVLHEALGVENAMVSTLHAFTHSQNLLDNSNPRDLRRARATTESVIPTTTGAMVAINHVVPELAGRVLGMSFRVPVAAVSLLDMTVRFERDVTVEEIHGAFEAAAAGSLKGILGVSNEPLVSVDYRGDTHSAVLDLLSTKVLQGRTAQLVVWYDNEWGYVSRVMDQLRWFVN